MKNISQKFPTKEPAKFLTLFELNLETFTINKKLVYHYDLVSVDDLIRNYSSCVGKWDSSKHNFSSNATAATFRKSLANFQEDFNVTLFDMQGLGRLLNRKGAQEPPERRHPLDLFVDNQTLLLIFPDQGHDIFKHQQAMVK